MTLNDAGVEGPTRGSFAEALAKQEQIFKDSFPAQIGVRITDIREGFAQAQIVVDERVQNPGGIAHGGALAGFGDTVAAWATFPSLEEGQYFTTIDFKASFTAPAKPGQTVTGEGTVVHKGRRTMVIDVRMYVGEGDERTLVCVMLVTQALLKVRDGSGRY